MCMCCTLFSMSPNCRDWYSFCFDIFVCILFLCVTNHGVQVILNSMPRKLVFLNKPDQVLLIINNTILIWTCVVSHFFLLLWMVFWETFLKMTKIFSSRHHIIMWKLKRGKTKMVCWRREYPSTGLFLKCCFYSQEEEHDTCLFLFFAQPCKNHRCCCKFVIPMALSAQREGGKKSGAVCRQMLGPHLQRQSMKCHKKKNTQSFTATVLGEGKKMPHHSHATILPFGLDLIGAKCIFMK